MNKDEQLERIKSELIKLAEDGEKLTEGWKILREREIDMELKFEDINNEFKNLKQRIIDHSGYIIDDEE